MTFYRSYFYLPVFSCLTKCPKTLTTFLLQDLINIESAIKWTGIMFGWVSSDLANWRTNTALSQHYDSLFLAMLNKGQLIVIVLASCYGDKGLSLSIVLCHILGAVLIHCNNNATWGTVTETAISICLNSHHEAVHDPSHFCRGVPLS